MKDEEKTKMNKTKEEIKNLFDEVIKLEMKQTQKEYIVIWHYCANYGENIIKADSPADAIRGHLFFGRKDIELMAFENNKETSAVKRIGSNDVLNE